ncbi:MAG: hypothetical protein ACJAYF_003386 [Arenicella sp.]|jgi:hypothetical protein
MDTHYFRAYAAGVIHTNNNPHTLMNLKNTFVLLSISALSACGGGGSSSGGSDPALNVSSCITVMTEPSAAIDGATNKIFTNTCNFQVNLTTVFATIISAPISLSQDQVHESITASPTSFIACRPPSTGVNQADFPNVALECV